MAELNLDDLAIFARVVESGGFAGTARALGVPTSTVSRTIARLEAMMGMRLLQRTTRSMRPTTEGRELYASVAAALTTLRSAARAIEPAPRRPKGRLRISAPTELCAAFRADVIVAFVERYPLVYPSARNVPTRVTAFRDFVIAAFDAWVVSSAEREGTTRELRR